MAQLVGTSEEVKGLHIQVEEGDLAIGRVSDNQVVVDNPTVSSHHARLTRQGELFTLKDLGSTNGTRVNAKDIDDVHLKPNDLLQFGSVEFVFEASAGEIEPQVEVKTPAAPVGESLGQGSAPESFSSISPFGSGRTKREPWFVIISVVGIVALLAIVYLIYSLVQSQ